MESFILFRLNDLKLLIGDSILDYWFEVTRFVLGFIGTLTYFLSVKYKYLYVELDDPEFNSNSIINNKVALVLFCIIGGIIPILMDIRLLLGCFFQGFILRAIISVFYFSATNKEFKKKEWEK